jgi:hypothetical protein
MSTVLAMLELDGDTEALLRAGADLERRLPPADGLLARMIAPSETGIVLWQLWASAQARQHHADDPEHHAALEASGIKALATGVRARAFPGATLQTFSA